MATESTEGVTYYPVEVLREFTVQCFTAAGVPAEDARVVAENLIEANLRGVDTHGITRLLGIYIKRLRAGLVNTRPNIRVVSESPSTVLLDGDNGLGAVVGRRAMELAIARARHAGSAWVGVRNSNHFGACAHFTMMAARADMVGIALTNGPKSMAPWGGVTPYLSTNPISFAVPSDDGPVVLDMATSVVAKGHIFLAAAKGERIPEGWAMDKRGRPTTDPREAIEGLVMPLAGHKGYGLSMMIDILCGILTGGAFGPYIGSLYTDMDRPQQVGHLFGAIDISRFVPVEEFKTRLGQMVREIRSCERAEGVERIYVPGEIEAEKAARRLREGVPIPEPIRQEFIAVARELGVPFE
ncbi:MAG TPA: Ldh family oxidoreductase [Chloroflexota bacterium]